MKNFKRTLALAGCLAALGMGGGKALAQGRGNFDPQQFMQRRLDNLREEMGVKDDAEWDAISGKITKVMEAQRDLMADQMRGMFRGGRRNAENGNNDQGQRPRRNGFGGEPSPAFTDLQKAVEANEPSAELKEKLAKLRAEKQAKQAALDKAQEDLKAVLTSRREAVAVLNGLLK